MQLNQNSLFTRIISMIITFAIMLSVLPPLELAAATGSVTIEPVDEEIKVGENVIVSWERSPATSDYFQFIVKRLDGKPAYNENEAGTVVVNKEVQENGSYRTVSTSFDTTDFQTEKWYKIFVKGFYADGSVCCEADSAYFYLIAGDTLSARFSNGEDILEIPANGYKESASIDSIYIDATTNWSVSSNKSWLTFSKDSGTAKDVNFLLYAEYNNSLRERTALITITSGDLEVELELVQAGRDLTASEMCEEDADELKIGYTSGDSQDHVTANITLPSGGLTNGSTVIWTSSNEAVISASGKVTCPKKTTNVTMTAELTNYSGNAFGSFTKKFTLTVIGEEGDIPEAKDPTVTALTVSPTSGKIDDTYTFTATAEDTDKVVFYVDEYFIGTVTSSTGTFRLKYSAFTSEGDREVTAYPCDTEGNEVRDTGAFKTASFTILSKGQLNPVTIISKDGQTISVNESFTLEWKAPANAPADTYYNVYIRRIVGANQSELVGTVTDIDACVTKIQGSYFAEAGSYRLEVYACAPEYAVSNASSISLTVQATAKAPTVTLEDVSTQVTLGEYITWGGLARGTDLTVVSIAVTNPAQNTIYFRETSANVLGDSYALGLLNNGKIATGLPNVPGLILNGSNYVAGTLDMTQPGTYKITVYAMNSAVSAPVEDDAYVVVSAKPATAPQVTSLTVSPQEGQIDDTYTFTATAANTTKVKFYVDDYYLGEAVSTNGTFVYMHRAFTSSGKRTVYAYPCDAAGNPIQTAGSFAQAYFTIETAEQLGAVTITSNDYRTTQVNTPVSLEWIKPTNAASNIGYNIYIWKNSAQIGNVITTQNTYALIPAVYFAEEGDYTLGVCAVAPGYQASPMRSVRVSVQTAQPTLDGYTLDRSTVSLGGNVLVNGVINGNGGIIAKISITALNTDYNTGSTCYSVYPNAPAYDLSNLPALSTVQNGFSGAGKYKIRVFVMMEGSSGADMLGSASLSVLSDARLPLGTPIITGSSTAIAGENYLLSWIPVENADYYELEIAETSYKQVIQSASGNTAVISGKTLRGLTGTQSATKIQLRLTAYSNETDTWLPSGTANKTITVLPAVESRAMILSTAMKSYTVAAGGMAEFIVTTTTDVTALRMKDGAGSFIIDTWTSGYSDENGKRIWKISQQINNPGVNNQRVVTFYTMIGDTEYNKADVGFTCVVKNQIGSFAIVSPAHESKQTENRDLAITWNAPTNVAVDSYIIHVWHGDKLVLSQTVGGINPEAVVIPDELLVRDDEAYQVRITARKADSDYAESTAVCRFTLLCPHDHVNQPVEKTSYINTGLDSSHNKVTTISYTCADCGQKNVGTTTTSGTGAHNWINLDKGGRVCNLCWYLDHDPNYYPRYNWGIKENIENDRLPIYQNIDAEGKPINAQPGRYVAKDDNITIWGEIGLSYLIEYPTANGTHWGLISTDQVINTEQSSDYVKLNGHVIYDYVFSDYDGKYYVSLNAAAKAFYGNVELLDGNRYVRATVYNAPEYQYYVATIDLRNSYGANAEFTVDTSNDGRRSIPILLWVSWINNEIYVDMAKFAQLVCGALKLSPTQYCLDKETILKNAPETKANIARMQLLVEFMEERHFIGRSFYNESLNGGMITFLEIAQPFAAMNIESYAKALESAYANIGANIDAFEDKILEEWFNIDTSLINNKFAMNVLSDNIRYDTLMKIIKGYESKAGPVLDKIEETVKMVKWDYDLFGLIMDSLNRMCQANSLSSRHAAESTVDFINTLISRSDGTPFIQGKIVNGKTVGYTVPGKDVCDKLLTGSQALGKILNACYDLYVYYMGSETVMYLKELIPYLEAGEKAALKAIIEKFESITFAADTSWEVAKVFLLSTIGENQYVAILNWVGDTVENATGTQEVIDYARKMKVANNIVEAIIAKAKDHIQLYKKSLSDDILISIWNDFAMCCKIDGLMNNYCVTYVKTYHKNPIVFIRNAITQESCTVKELEYEVGIQARVIEQALEWAEDEIASLKN